MDCRFTVSLVGRSGRKTSERVFAFAGGGSGGLVIPVSLFWFYFGGFCFGVEDGWRAIGQVVVSLVFGDSLIGSFFLSRRCEFGLRLFSCWYCFPGR